MTETYSGTRAADLYLDLLARSLTRALHEDNDEIIGVVNSMGSPGWKRRAGVVVAPALRKLGYELVRKWPYDESIRENGRDWPARAESMAGLKRMANTRQCIESVLADDVPGDLVETGVWRGGMSIFMRGVLEARGDTRRNVWLADSFEGLPTVENRSFAQDVGDNYDYEILSVGVEQVRANFRRYGLLDDRVKFLVGWFKDTLPVAPVETISVLRLDGDMYESTIQALDSLYPKLSSGGFCIVDDYGVIDACRQAVTDYRRDHGSDEEIVDIDGWGAYWRKV